MTKNRNRKKLHVRSDTRGRAAVRRDRVAPDAAPRARKVSESSAKRSARASTTDKDTQSTNGRARDTIAPRGKMRRGAESDAIDWRWLARGAWSEIVVPALNYYLSTHVSAESRAPIERTRDQIIRQEPTI